MLCLKREGGRKERGEKKKRDEKKRDEKLKKNSLFNSKLIIYKDKNILSIRYIMKIYKKIIVAIFVISILFTATYAAEQLSGSRLTAQPEIDKKAMEDINLVSLRFCNDGINPVNLKAQLYLT